MGTQPPSFCIIPILPRLSPDVCIAEVYRRSPAWDGVDPTYLDKEAGTASLQSNSTREHNPTLDAFLPSPPLPSSQFSQSQGLQLFPGIGDVTPRSRTASPTQSEQQEEDEIIELFGPAPSVSSSDRLTTLYISNRHTGEIAQAWVVSEADI